VEVFLPSKGGGNAALIVKVSEPGIGADAFNGYEVALDAGGQFLRLGRQRPQGAKRLTRGPCGTLAVPEPGTNQEVAQSGRIR
jgi:hypothetical protein